MSGRYLLWIDQQSPNSDICQCVKDESLALLHASDFYHGLDLLASHQVELIFVDSEQKDMPMLEMVKLLHKRNESVPILCLVDSSQSELASRALTNGAIDYLLKPYISSQLQRCIRNAKVMVDRLDDMVVESHVSKQILRLANRAAQTSDATILIQGPSGTGKEKLAQFIHQASVRSEQAFVAVNCAAIPENMLEAMLFGYNKGAFTGAVANQVGKFELANGGTLLLDEISELPLDLQSKLLRVLQEREVERLGSHQGIALDVRVIAACNRNLRELVEQGRFREDLYYRLDVLQLNWPALSERREDILPLANHFIDKYGDSKHYLSEDACSVMLSYNWPGNVRELENVIQRALVMARGVELQVDDLNLPKCSVPAAKFCAAQLKQNKRQAEFDYIYELLHRFRGHRSRTAEALGMTTRALRYKLVAMREVGMDVDSIA
ncbi:sigma-54 dependent transcriptional regulator [Aestuariibacter sp. A3R04]|uniref:sigma-54-dependent transcriptional regulator n=1 Tax=Aestuariibacter sp. A3R04 TaxID=2841571 RepID=UPI001C0948CD|nr:sigma-54 dependent transcriptional regulator [Aestuariibacter sp. A3R04]MBU3023116.1 sigma-54 dependent transcriptional regulator [Aestuariibacter sp. A3R04]